MILPVHDRLRGHVTRLLSTLYSIDEAAVESLTKLFTQCNFTRREWCSL